MGQLAGNLTNPVPAIAGQVQPSTSSISGPLGGNQSVSYSAPQTQSADMVRPPFLRAAMQGPGGTPDALSPALTKGGKLAVLLMSGLKGALAGRAASEQSVLASGGHRSGGAGLGFQAGYSQPFQEAQQRQEAQIGQAGLQPIPLPGGVTVPAAIAPKFLSPYLGYQGKIGAAQIGAQGKEQAAQTEAGGRVAAANINKRFLVVPGVGVYDTAQSDEKGKPALIPGTSQSIQVTPEIAKEFNMPDEFVGQRMKISDLTGQERAQNQATTVTQGAAGPALVNKQTKQTTSLGLGNPGTGRPMEVADPDNPGQTKIVSGNQAMAQGAAGKGSASVAVAKKAAESELPTKVGDQKVFFNTAIQHADLLRQAVKALGNGDQQTLNSLQNRFANEFGSAGPVTAQAIADAYTREVSKMLTGGHMTDSEIATVGGTVNPGRQNYAQIDSVLGAYQALAKSKLNQLNKQKQNAVNAAQPQGAKSAQRNTSANDPLGIR